MTERNSRATRRTLLDASRHGSDVELLRRLRDKLAARLDDPDLAARDFAPLSRRLTEVTKGIIDAEKQALVASDEPAPDEPFDPSSI